LRQTASGSPPASPPFQAPAKPLRMASISRSLLLPGSRMQMASLCRSRSHLCGNRRQFPQRRTVNTTAVAWPHHRAPASSGTLNITLGSWSRHAATFMKQPPRCATNIAVVSGSGQTTEVGTSFANPLVVVVTDSNGNGVPNVTVTFTAPAQVSRPEPRGHHQQWQAQVVANNNRRRSHHHRGRAAVSTPATSLKRAARPSHSPGRRARRSPLWRRRHLQSQSGQQWICRRS